MAFASADAPNDPLLQPLSHKATPTLGPAAPAGAATKAPLLPMLLYLATLIAPVFAAQGTPMAPNPSPFATLGSPAAGMCPPLPIWHPL